MRLGIDVGSTTVKLTIIEPQNKELIFTCYERHNAKQVDAVLTILENVEKKFPHSYFRVAVCGSGGRPVADAVGVNYIQEVVANSAAICQLYPGTRTAIELGGQDAKIIFFHYDEIQKHTAISDMRMNGSCAGGTGAFIDEIAALLNIATEEFDTVASKGTIVYDISGRCGVFAKTDIQPLLSQGAYKEDIALSTFHAIAKQTIGGLAQGLELKPPVLFEGGPLTFNHTLVKVFAERLGLAENDVIIPEHPESIVSRGVAIGVDDLFPLSESDSDALTLKEVIEKLKNNYSATTQHNSEDSGKFFNNTSEKLDFINRHKSNLLYPIKLETTNKLNVFLGIDSGSTTSKCVIIDENENLVDSFYSNNHGDPLDTVKKGLSQLNKKYKQLNIDLNILGVGTTGYGEHLFAEAFRADFHIVETVAHTEASKKYVPDVSFILDIGGQDMKAIWVNNGVISNIVVNEACSSGCGSFLETFAHSLDIPVNDIAERAFDSELPANLGSRCTVFMNSTIISEQRQGKKTDDIMAGLCRSIIENVFTKVVRVGNISELGSHIVVQGGTFRNFAVLRALEEYIDKQVKLAPYPGEMGALGVALLTKHQIAENGYTDGNHSSFIGLDTITEFEYTRESDIPCPYCSNHCLRIVTKFSTGDKYITGNRCDRGLTLDSVRQAQQSLNFSKENTPDMFKIRERYLYKDYSYMQVCDEKDEIIGIPKVLEFWDSMPFWKTFFRALGFKVKLSEDSSQNLYESGLMYVSSDTICFPAKLVHGHIQNLAMQGVDRIFMPYIMHMPTEGVDKVSPYVCPVIMGYPMVIRNFEAPEERYQTTFDTPVFHWYSHKDRYRQICDYAEKNLRVSKYEAGAAFDWGMDALNNFRETILYKGQKIIDYINENDEYAIVLGSRPYHNDQLISHNISNMFTRLGIPVLTLDSLPGLNETDLRYTRAEITNVFHTRLLAGAKVAANNPRLEFAQIISFGCGHDAILSDEVTRILNEVSAKSPLLLKVDESHAEGPLNIRIKSFIETVKLRRNKLNQGEHFQNTILSLPDPYITKFNKDDKKDRTVIIPNIYGPVSMILKGAFKKNGFKVKTIPVGGTKEIKIGKQHTQ